MIDLEEYTTSELVAVIASRELEDGKTVFAGAGLPLVSAALAQKTRSPNLTIIFEGGAVAPILDPTMLPYSTNEGRAARMAVMCPPPFDLFSLQQRGYVDYGFLGGAQIDKRGNINTSVIGDYAKPKTRLPGGGGANDIISSCNRTIIVTHHEKRRFVEKVDFITSPGYLGGEGARSESGLIFGKVYKLVSHLCTMGFDEKSQTMKVEKLNPGVTLDDVLNNTGFVPIIPDSVEFNGPPTQKELEILRGLDPEGRYVSHPKG